MPVAGELIRGEFAEVLGRWHPDGMRRIDRWRPASIALVGPRGSGKTSLGAELAARAPQFTLIDHPEHAGLALLLLDASAVAGRTELRMLDEAARHGCRVVCALNKIDVHEGWRAVLARNAAVLGGRPIVPVSARLARIARTELSGAAAARVVTASGIAELIGALEAAVDDEDGRASVAAVVAEQAEARIRAMADSLRNGDDVAELRARRARLVAERDGGRTDAMASLRSQVQLARVDLVHEVGAQVRALNAAVRERVDTANASELGDVPTQLDALVHRLADRLDESTRARIERVSRRILGTAPPRSTGPIGASPRISPPQANGSNPTEGRLTIALGASAGVALGRLAIAPLTMIPALDAATVPLTLVLGGGAAWWFTRSRSQLARRARLRQWVSDALVDAKAQLEQREVSALVEGEAMIADEIARFAAGRTTQTDGEIEALDAEIRQLGAHRAARLASCQRDLAVVGDGLRELRADDGVEPDLDPARR